MQDPNSGNNSLSDDHSVDDLGALSEEEKSLVEDAPSEEDPKPIISIVGRPNVGKSTLYNRLTRSRDAIVDDRPGVTRDRMVGVGRVGKKPYWVVDTGGIESDDEGIHLLMKDQVDQALEDSDAVIFIVDGRDGATPVDFEIAKQLRLNERIKVYLAVNKSEGLNKGIVAADFYQLGLDEPIIVSGKNGDGIHKLLNSVLTETEGRIQEESSYEIPSGVARLAIVGRPNVGKSTLLNSLVGEDRVVVYDMPGTTRDSIHVPFQFNDKEYVLIDTAGMRKKSRIDDRVERFSVMKTLRAVELAQVVAVVLDAREGIVDQDNRLINLVFNSGRSLMILVNKWDGMSKYDREQIRAQIDRKFGHMGNIPIEFISAKYGKGINIIMPLVDKLYDSAMTDMGTGRINTILKDAEERRNPPMVGNFRIKLKFGHQGGMNPPHVIIHGNQLDKLPQTYQRYLSNTFEKAFDMVGTKVRLSFKTSDNPFHDASEKPSRKSKDKVKFRGSRKKSARTGG
ncbi:ribosome biogenesis GTPase Der [Arenicella sp. 4NH20-0111]|uniref:ribosome biogenesis GTPase Der n=1 Tax=Arenicella sp. 4NH20-0111 TaxID=3127648 RepID=UPI00310C03A1